MPPFPQDVCDKLLKFRDISSGCYADIVLLDRYGISDLPFTPDAVLDMGANVGVFSALAALLWPEARILAVEPHPETFLTLQEMNDDPQIERMNAGLGNGQLDAWLDVHSTGHVYACRRQAMDEAPYRGGLPMLADVRGFPIASFIQRIEPFSAALVKIDVEGAESELFIDPEAIPALQRAAAIVMELHLWPQRHPTRGRGHPLAWFYEFAQTHRIELKVLSPNGGMARLIHKRYFDT